MPTGPSGLAKATEIEDRPILDTMGGMVSGTR